MAPPERRIKQLVAEARAHISRELLAHPMIALCVENTARFVARKLLDEIETLKADHARDVAAANRAIKLAQRGGK